MDSRHLVSRERRKIGKIERQSCSECRNFVTLHRSQSPRALLAHRTWPREVAVRIASTRVSRAAAVSNLRGDLADDNFLVQSLVTLASQSLLSVKVISSCWPSTTSESRWKVSNCQIYLRLGLTLGRVAGNILSPSTPSNTVAVRAKTSRSRKTTCSIADTLT